MRHNTLNGLAIRLALIGGFLIASTPVSAEPPLMAGLISDTDALPLYKEESPVIPNSGRSLPAPDQVASRLPDPATVARATSSVTGTEYFLDTLPLVTLGQYIRAGHVTLNDKPHGQIVRNEGFWNNAFAQEIVNLDFGADKGARPGDKLLAYVLNENFHQGFNTEKKVRHPTKDEDGKVLENEIANDMWDLELSQETGVWRKEVKFFDNFMLPTKELKGDMVRIVGKLVIEEVGAKRSRARVVEMIELIPRGSFVTPYPKNVPKMLSQSHKGTGKNLSGYILDNREGYLLGSENDVVYIDLGANSQVKPGDRFVILASSTEEPEVVRSLIPKFEPIYKDPPRKMLDRRIGELVVVTVGDNSSTAMILDSLEPILPGHRIKSKR